MKRFFRMAALLAGLCLACCSCGAGEPRRIQTADTAMGTVIQLNIYTRKPQAQSGDEILKLIRELEEKQLSWRLETSEVHGVNRSAGSDEGFLISAELAQVLEQCFEVTGRAGGAFDVTLGPLIRLWDIDSWAAGLQEGEFRAPSWEELEQALALCGTDKIRFEQEEGGALLYLETGVQLDLGAVGKGLALTRILAYLEKNGEVTGATISVGGSVLTYGEKPDGTAWRIGIADPWDTSANLGVISLKGQWCVSTSGDYERYAEAGGVRYHHILDPATGYPADSGLHSVTVVTKDGLLSDALSTACFVLGPEEGMALVQSYGAEALFVTDEGEILMTPGMEAMFQETR